MSCRELKTKLSKIAVRSGTRQSPTFVITLTKVGSTLSPEELQPHAWSWTAYRGTTNIRGCRYPSSENLAGNA